MKTANLSGGVEIEEFTLLFKSSREFFFAPVIEYGPLADWKDIAGGGQEMQDIFWYIKEAIDAYYDGRPFQVTVKAGCLIGRKEDAATMRARATERTSMADIASSFEDDEEDTGLPMRLATGSVQMADPDDLEVEEILPGDPGDFDLDVGSQAEQELEAFIEGAKRPHHLDD